MFNSCCFYLQLHHIRLTSICPMPFDKNIPFPTCRLFLGDTVFIATSHRHISVCITLSWNILQVCVQRLCECVQCAWKDFRLSSALGGWFWSTKCKSTFSNVKSRAFSANAWSDFTVPSRRLFHCLVNVCRDTFLQIAVIRSQGYLFLPNKSLIDLNSPGLSVCTIKLEMHKSIDQYLP